MKKDMSERTRRAELLAASPSESVIRLGDASLEDTGPPVLLSGPEVGMVMLTVREPIESTRMHLGEVLVTKSEVVHRDVRGWAMRIGDDLAAVLAAAICEAEHEADGPLARDIEELCAHTAAELQKQRIAEWQDLAPTIVQFEEMDA